MASEIARIDEWRGGTGRRIERAILLNSTSPTRERVARLMAKVLAKSRAKAVAFGWVDWMAPDLFAPVIAVDATPLSRDGAYRDFLMPSRFGVKWRLRLYGRRVRVDRHTEAAAMFLGGYFRVLMNELRVPAIGDSSADPFRWLTHTVRAHRWIGFLPQTPEALRVLRVEAKRLSESVSPELRPAYGAAAGVIGDPNRLGDPLLLLGNALDDAGEFDRACELHEAAYEIAVYRSDPGMAADAAMWRARALRKLSRWPAAVAGYELAIRIAALEEDWRRIAVATTGVGWLRLNCGAVPEAHDLFGEALQIARTADDDHALALAQHGLMSTARKMGDRIAAARHAVLAATSYPDAGDRALMAVAAGTLLWEAGQLDAAWDAYEAGARLSATPDGRALATLGLSYLSALKGDTAGFRKYDRAVSDLLGMCSPHAVVQAMLYRGKALHVLGDPRSKQALRSALEEAERWGLNAFYFEVEAELASPKKAQPGPHEPMVHEIQAGLRALQPA
jgi:tetratricopeptide (TPR) repeat protein